MQHALVEKMASEGQIRPEAKAAIYADCSRLIKLATEGQQLPIPQNVQRVIDFGVGFTSNMMVNTAWRKLMQARGLNKTVESIDKSRTGILADPAFSEYAAKADQRFTELAKVAPTVAANPARAKAIISRTLHTGFTNEDMNHLAILQAIHTAGDPDYATKVDRKMSKKASAERLGEMYADVLCLVKEAGIAKTAAGISVGTAGQILKHMALVSSIPLLAGVGQGLAAEYAASRDSRRMAERLRNSYNEALRLSDKEDLNRRSGASLKDHPADSLRIFQALAHFAPHVAAQPDAAKSFMARIIENGQAVDTAEVKQLTDIEKNLASAGSRSPFFEGFSKGVSNLGLGEGIRSTLKDTTGPLRERTQASILRDIKG